MVKSGPFGRYGKLLLYVVVVVLINLVGVTLFTRFDLTANRVYSLSPASKEVVATLSEPLTFKIFFSANLPAPYNGVERYVHDLLQEYALAGNNYFNYQFYNPAGDDETAAYNQKMARSYGIQPVQIRAIEQDEVKFQKAFMGLVIIHGDLVESLPAITATEGLEYKLTTAIMRMNNKISRLLALPEKIKVNLFLSSSLQQVGPYMNLENLESLPESISTLVSRLNDQLYDQIEFSFLDPSTAPEAAKKAAAEQVMELKWKDFTNRQGQKIAGDHGYAGLSISFSGQRQDLHLISSVNVPIFGAQYMLTPLEDLEVMLNVAIENVIGINEKIAYLGSHGTLPLQAARAMPGQPQPEAASNFHRLLSQEYTPDMVTLEQVSLLSGVKTLIIVRPTETFTDWDLYRLDQFLLQGNNIAVFYDPFQEKMPPRNMMMMGQGPSYVPLATGLEKLIAHYGVSVKEAYVMDSECFKQQLSPAQGGGERALYFAPLIENRNINKNHPFISNIKGLVMIKAAPLTVDVEKLAAAGIKAEKLFSSSERSWLMQDRIDFNPTLMQPPVTDEGFSSYALAYLLEGSFTSYFSGRPVPEKPQDSDALAEESPTSAEEDLKDGEAEDGEAEESKVLTSLAEEGGLESLGGRLEKGKPGRIIVVGSADILGNNIVDEGGSTPNAQLLMNMVDYLNGRQELAVLRSKTQRFNPLVDVAPESRSLIKGANLVGLPLLVIFAGLFAWLRRGARRRKLKQMFAQ
ncbi:MAG: ABC transporter permease [Deltaproteobacteria bacterium]|nr:MAG: ABC transporter permease [Deltaproteobacteria bacterium]